MASATQPGSIKPNSGKTNFGSSVVDGNRVAMVGTGSWFQTQDNTPTTALISPLANISGSAVTTLIVPQNATTITIYSSVTLQVSEISGTSSLSQYFLVPATTIVTLPVARLLNLYILPSSGTNAIQFYFTTV